MEFPSHERLTVRLNAFVADALDELQRNHPDGFDLGVLGLVYEIVLPREGGLHLKRLESGYTPADDSWSYIGYWCSDHRSWVQEKLFEEAYDNSQSSSSYDSDDDGDESDDDAE
jgi:hypothetical protein